MKYTLITVLLLTFQAVFGSSAYAQSGDNSWPTCPRGNCPELSKEARKKNADNLEAFARFLREGREQNKAKNASVKATLATNVGNSSVADQCSAFSDVESWGGKFTNILHQNKFAALYGEPKSENKDERTRYKGPPDLVRLCPNYKDMKNDSKDELWTLIGVRWVYHESSCNPSATLAPKSVKKGGAPNGTAQGLLQLHSGTEGKYSAGCRNGDALNPNRTIQCGLTMLNDQVLRGENLLSSRSYWSTLKPQNTEVPRSIGMPVSHYIMTLVCKYPSCGQNMTDCNKLIAEFAAKARVEDAERKDRMGWNRKARPRVASTSSGAK